MQEEQKVERDLPFNFIKKHKDYLKFSKSQNKVVSKHFLILCCPSDDTDSSVLKVGITVTKKIGNAVVRNRIKRRVRAYFRQFFMDELDGLMINVIAIRDSSDISWRKFSSELNYLLQKIKNNKR